MKRSLSGPQAVAKATGVSTDTLRHYERLGLLMSVERSSAGYRQYSQAVVDRVLLIQRALVVGFTLRELKRVLTQRDKGGVPCHNVRTLVGERLQALDRRITELVALRDQLAGLMDDWDKRLARTGEGERAYLLDTLGAQSAVEYARTNRRAQPPGREPRRRS